MVTSGLSDLQETPVIHDRNRGDATVGEFDSIFAASIGEPHLCVYNTRSPPPNPIDGTMLCPSPTNNTLDLILTSLAGQFQDTHSPHKLSDHDIVSETWKLSFPL